MSQNYVSPYMLFRNFAVLFLLGFTVIILANCATKKEWGKVSATKDQIERDKIRCTREFLTPGAGGAVRHKTVDRKCMEKLGYKLF